MKMLEDIVAELTDEQLKEGFFEIQEWRKEGVLTKGIVRHVYNIFTSQANVQYPLHAMDVPFLYEISKRYLGQKA